MLSHVRALLRSLSLICLLMHFGIGRKSPEPALEDPDVNRNVVDLIESKGYVVENYTVQTSDGYLLGTFRIPHGRNQTARDKSNSRPVALVMPAIFTDSSIWVMNFPEQSLGFILADAGYDVWLGCPRGCTYSEKNVDIPTNTSRFWDFSWEETGTKDLPALVDFILEKTNQEKLFLVGHSMGSTVSLVFLSLRPEYNRKVKALMAMGPVANLTHMTNIMRDLLPYRDLLYRFSGNINYGGIFDHNVSESVMKLVCSLHIVKATECNILAFFGESDESPSQYNRSRVPVYLSHIPGGGSAKQLYHYAQVAVAERFVRFDYGEIENLHRYGQEKPPEYPLEKITAPVALFGSAEDDLADPRDVADLRKTLSNVIEFYSVPFSPFTHNDFTWAIDAYKYVYKRMISIMNKYIEA